MAGGSLAAPTSLPDCAQTYLSFFKGNLSLIFSAEAVSDGDTMLFIRGICYVIFCFKGTMVCVFQSYNLAEDWDGQ